MAASQEPDLHSLFEKKFTFEKVEDWSLPCVGNTFEDNLWNIENLQELKQQLNGVKSLLNDKGEKWHKHTLSINKAGLVRDYVKKVIKPEILTQAWCKLFEILSSYTLLPFSIEKLTTVHICEAPGAFVSALNYYLCANCPSLDEWRWIANTLNPYYEEHSIKNVVVDDRLIFPTLTNWHFGLSNTGDIMEPDYISDISAFLEKEKPIHLITADGSFNCLDDPAEQELLVAKIQLKEVLIALTNLNAGGSFVLKKFTFFECITVCTMYLLNCTFEKIHVFKPFTSKTGNSEVYVICLGYLGAENFLLHLQKIDSCLTEETKAMFPLSSIPHSFLSQIHECAKMFAEWQMHSIKENVVLFDSLSLDDTVNIELVKETCARMYILKYSLVPIDESYYYKLCPANKKYFTSLYGNHKADLRTIYFQVVGETYENLKQVQELEWDAFLQDVQNKVNLCFSMNKKRKRDEELLWKYVKQEVSKRMKSKNYSNWKTFGKKIKQIKNSKFCNPLLLHLWNKLSCHTQIQPEFHQQKSFYHWNWNPLGNLLNEIKKKESSFILLTADSNISVNNYILCGLTECLDQDVDVFELSSGSTKSSMFQKIVVVNTVLWFENSLHQEILIKNRLVKTLHDVIEVLQDGDIVIIHVQSLFTRFTVGLFYMLISMFQKFFTLLPSPSAPSECGQVWVLAEFKEQSERNRLLNYLKEISDTYLTEKNDILEIVPIKALCGTEYHNHLVTCSNLHLMQRLQSLIVAEKKRLQQSSS